MATPNSAIIDRAIQVHDLQADVARFFTCPHEQMALSLAELSAVANPEKFLRAELLRHLRASGWVASKEMEYRKHGIKRYLDIVVFDGGGAEPLCVIELMHQDARRSGTWALTAGMDADSHLFRPDAPLMQLGLFSVMHPLAHQPAPAEGGADFARALADWSKARNWAGAVTIARTAAQRFQHDGMGSVEGYLEYFIGVRKSAAARTREAVPARQGGRPVPAC